MTDAIANPLPYEPDAQQGHRAERNRRLKLTLVVAVLTKPLSLLSKLIIGPLLWHYLKPEGEGYGLYQTLIGTATLLSLTNLGLHLGLINRLIDCHVANDRERASGYVSSLLITTGMMVGALLVIWTVVAAAVPWGRVFHVVDPGLARQAPWALWIAGSATLLSFVVGFPSSVYTGYQENARAFGWDAATKLVVFGASLAVLCTKWGLIGVALATCGSQLLVMFLNCVFLFRDKPWLLPRLSRFQWAFVRSTLGQGIFLFALQASISVIYQCDKVVIGTARQAADVGVYSFVVDAFIIAYGLYIMVLSPLWSFHGEALRRGDWAWAKKGMRWSMAIGMLAVGGCLATLLVAGDWVFRTWMHAPIPHVPRMLILAVGTMFLTRVWVDCHSILLNAAGMLKPQMVFFLAHAGLNLLVATLVAKRFGVIGVAWATPATALVTGVWGASWMFHRLAKQYTPGAHLAAPIDPTALAGAE